MRARMLSRVALLALLLGAGCDSVWGIHAITGTPDGAVDAAGDGHGSGMTCEGTPPFDVCVATPTAPLLLEGTGSNELDTSQPPGAMPCVPYTGLLGADACVLAGTTVSVTNLAVIGDHPLVLVATGDLTVSAQLDVSSHPGVDHGPGADPVACVAGTMAAGIGAGGWGASFGGMGGRGGAPSGAMGGTPAGPSGVSALRGGCEGGAGSGTSVNKPGEGGGAILLVAGGTIRIEGVVDASGAGGGGGDSGTTSGGGGCGGGSGGMIVLEAAQIDLEANGKLFANGGGGGQGGGQPGGGDGASGGESAGPTAAAAGGGSVSVSGAHGGAGAASPATDGSPGADVQLVQVGAGGGGGAVGVIVLRASASVTGVVSAGSAANVSPAPSSVPPP